MRRPDVELHALEDGGDVVAVKAERALHAPRVDRARAHPFVDRDLMHRRRPVASQHLRNAGAVLQVRRQLIFAAEHGQGSPGEHSQLELRVERAAVVVHSSKRLVSG